MKTIVLFLFIFFGFVFSGSAQNAADRAFTIQNTNVAALQKLAERYSSRNKLLKSGSHSFKQTLILHGRIAYLSGIDNNGYPVYDYDDNLDAAISIKTNYIWQDGISGLNLTGKGVEIGQWEASGLPLTSHQEFSDNVTHMEEVSVSEHATHVACTMIGLGIFAQAQGMASGAKIVARKSNNDEEELTEFAANGGILSNHSYSTGDPDGKIEKYGVYSYKSGEWDEITFNAPYLTICKSAGNNRNDGVNTSDKGYDIIYTVSASKNVLTVGAVDDVTGWNPMDIIQSEFSNWGQPMTGE